MPAVRTPCPRGSGPAGRGPRLAALSFAIVFLLGGCGYPFNPEGRVTVHEPGGVHPGYTLYNVIYLLDYIHKCLVVVDQNGNPVWSFLDSVSWTGSSIEPLGDAEITPDGTIVTLFGTHSMNAGLYEIDPATHEVVWAYDAVMAHHDADVLPDGSILFLYQYETSAPGHPRIIADGVRIIDPAGNETLWDWRAEDHLDFEDHCPVCAPADWLHANTVIHREEPGGEAIYVHLRNRNRIVKIGRETGEIIWSLGDGGDFGQGLFSHAHDPEFLDSGNILLFDNGMHRDGSTADGFSRAIEIAFDPEAGTAEIVWEYAGETPFYSGVMGDADRLPNGNTLITDATNGRIVEVSPDREIVWEYVLNRYHNIYKSERLETWPPVAAR